MKKILIVLLVTLAINSYAQDTSIHTLKGILLEQLRSTHNSKEWFVPANIALEGLTPEQVNWKDGSGNHSIGQLASHLIYWDLQQLNSFKKLPQPPFDGNNDETFNSYTHDSWKAVTQKLDSVLTAWEQAVEQADDIKLQSWFSTVAHIGTHNAYHLGQIIYIRKLQNAWDPEKGVK